MLVDLDGAIDRILFLQLEGEILLLNALLIVGVLLVVHLIPHILSSEAGWAPR